VNPDSILWRDPVPASAAPRRGETIEDSIFFPDSNAPFFTSAARAAWRPDRGAAFLPVPRPVPSLLSPNYRPDMILFLKSLKKFADVIETTK
jgi:hypothetical protein